MDESRRTAIRKKIGWSNPSVFAAGRLARRQGYDDLLINAFPAIELRVPQARLVLVIGGICRSPEEQEFLEHLMRLAEKRQILDHVTFTPCVNQERLADY